MTTPMAPATPKSPGPCAEHVGAEHVRLGGEPAAGLQRVHLGEDAQVPDDLQHETTSRTRGGREDDEAEPLDAGGAVERRRLEHLAGHLAEGGVRREGDERDALPHDDDRSTKKNDHGSMQPRVVRPVVVPVMVLSAQLTTPYWVSKIQPQTTVAASGGIAQASSRPTETSMRSRGRAASSGQATRMPRTMIRPS